MRVVVAEELKTMERGGIRPFLIALIVGFLAFACPVFADEPQNDLSKFFSDVVKVITGDARQPAVRMLQAEPVMDVPEDEAKERAARLIAYLNAASRWVDECCDLTPKQHAELQAFVAKHVEQSQKNYLKNYTVRQQQEPISDYMPIKFVAKSGAGYLATKYDWNQFLKTLLTPEQYERWEPASDERIKHLQRAQMGRFINLVDEELFLTIEQRDGIEGVLEESFYRDDALNLYALIVQSYYLNYQPAGALLQRIPDGILNDAQTDRLKDLTSTQNYGTDSETYITFMSNEGFDTWQKKLDEALQKQNSRLLRAANVRVEYLADQFNLSESKRRRLATAAKGVVIYELQKWKETNKAQLKTWEEQAAQNPGLNFGWSLMAPQTSQIDSNELWQQACQEVGVKENGIASAARQAHRAADAAYLVSLLDRELWFTIEQRDQMQALMEKKLPKLLKVDPYYYIQELVLIAIPLARIEEDELKDVLNEEQIAGWRKLKSQFQFQGQNVMFTLRNQAQFGFPLPQ